MYHLVVYLLALFSVAYSNPLALSTDVYFCCYYVTIGFCNPNDPSLLNCKHICNDPKQHCRGYQDFASGAVPQQQQQNQAQQSFGTNFNDQFPSYNLGSFNWPGFNQNYFAQNTHQVYPGPSVPIQHSSVLNTNSQWPYEYLAAGEKSEEKPKKYAPLPKEPLSPLDVNSAYAHLNIPVAKKMLDNQSMRRKIVVKIPAPPPNKTKPTFSTELIQERSSVPAELQMNVGHTLFGLPIEEFARNDEAAANLFSSSEQRDFAKASELIDIATPKNLLAGIKTGFQPSPSESSNSNSPSTSSFDHIDVQVALEAPLESPVSDAEILGGIVGAETLLPSLPTVSNSAGILPKAIYPVLPPISNDTESNFAYPYSQADYLAHVPAVPAYQPALPNATPQLLQAFTPEQLAAASPPGGQYPHQITSQTVQVPLPTSVQQSAPVLPTSVPVPPQVQVNQPVYAQPPPGSIYPPAYQGPNGQQYPFVPQQWNTQQWNQQQYYQPQQYAPSQYDPVTVAQIQLAKAFAAAIDEPLKNSTGNSSEAMVRQTARATAEIAETLIQNPSHFLQGENASREALSAFWTAPLASQIAAAEHGFESLASVQKTLFQNLIGDTNEFLNQYYGQQIQHTDPLIVPKNVLPSPSVILPSNFPPQENPQTLPFQYPGQAVHFPSNVQPATQGVGAPILPFPSLTPQVELPPVKDIDASFENHVSSLVNPSPLFAGTAENPAIVLPPLTIQHSASISEKPSFITKTELLAKFSEGGTNPTLVLGEEEGIQEASIDHQALCCFLTTQGLCNTSNEWMKNNCPNTCQPGNCKGLWFSNQANQQSVVQPPANQFQNFPQQSFPQNSFPQQTFPVPARNNDPFWGWSNSNVNNNQQNLWGQQQQFPFYQNQFASESTFNQVQPNHRQGTPQSNQFQQRAPIPILPSVSPSAPLDINSINSPIKKKVIEERVRSSIVKLPEVKDIVEIEPSTEVTVEKIESKSLLTREFVPIKSEFPTFNVGPEDTVTFKPSTQGNDVYRKSFGFAALGNVRSRLVEALHKFDRNGNRLPAPKLGSTTSNSKITTTTEIPRRTIPVFEPQPNLFATNSTSRPCFGWELCADIIDGVRQRVCFCQDVTVGRKCGPYHKYAELVGERCHGADVEIKLT